MTIIEMLQQSAVLSILGMSIVFVFLWVMIVCVNFAGKFFHAIDNSKNVKQSDTDLHGKTSGAVAPEITVAISAAVSEYRRGE